MSENLPPRPLPPGLYEQIVDGALDRRLSKSREFSLLVDAVAIGDDDSHTILADYLRQVLSEALDGVTGEDRLARQIELVNRILKDYAINERLFHWQSQSTTSSDSPTGRRYVEHQQRGYTVLLFGREQKSRNSLAQPYFFLGPAQYVSHSGSRPMSITWRLHDPLPARLFRALARLAVA